MSSDEKHAAPIEVEVKKKKSKSLTCDKIGQVFYDKKEGTFCGRTPRDWGFLFVFLVLFYAVLAGYFALLFTIFTKGIMVAKIPFRQGNNCLNGPAPGFSYRPLIDNKTNTMAVSSNLNSQSYQNYKWQFDLYMSDYIRLAANGKICQANGNYSDASGPCSFDLAQLGPCKNGSSVLAAGAGLCIYWHINNLYGWLPDISSSSGSTNGLIYCTGNNATDNQNLGTIQYYPSQTVGGTVYGFIQNFYFPFLNQDSYLSPIAAVFLSNMTRNVSMNLVCNLINVRNMALNSMMVTVSLSTS